MLGKKLKTPIGLDISDLSLKMVQLNKIGDKIKIQALNKIDLPKGIIENGEIKNKEMALNYLEKLLSKPKIGSINTNEVVACLPETRTFIKLITIEQSPNNLNDIIEAEIEKHVPMSINDIYYDWQKIKEDGNLTYVLIGAAPKNIVDQYINFLNSAKLTPLALEIEGAAICRSLLAEENPKNKKTDNQNYAIIDIGAKRSGIIIYANRTIILTISLDISSDEITTNIAKTLEIKPEQAEKAKIICGLDEDKAQGIIKEILSDMIKNLINKIQNTLDFYNNNHSENGQINQILLCGGGSNIKNLTDIIEKELQIPTTLGDPFKNLNELKEKLNEKMTETHELDREHNINNVDSLLIQQNSSLSYVAAIGLALRKVFLNN